MINLKLALILGAATVFSGAEASANPYEGTWFRCTTESRGIQFNNRGRDINLTRSIVADACRSDRRTINAECDANVFCTQEGNVTPPPYYPPTQPVPPIYSNYTCTTQSRGINFRNVSDNFELARRTVVDACMRDNRTVNQECRVNVGCSQNGGGMPGPGFPGNPVPVHPAPSQFMCTTMSSGVTYRNVSFNIQSATNAVVNACERDPRSFMPECRQNIRCAAAGNYPGPLASEGESNPELESILRDIGSDVVEVPSEE